MRLTTRISACGEKALSKFPFMRRTLEECCDANGKFVEALAREALKGDLITFDSKDNSTTCAMAIEYIKHLHACLDHIDDSDDSSAEDNNSKEVSIAHRKMDSGKVVFVRITIREKGDAIRLIYEIGNPYEVKGNAMTHAWNFAVMCYRIGIWLKEGFAKGCGKVLILEEGKGAHGISEEAARLNGKDAALKSNQRQKQSAGDDLTKVAMK